MQKDNLKKLIEELVEKLPFSKVGASFEEDESGAIWYHITSDDSRFLIGKDSVKAVAHMMAERAKFFKTNIEMDPMSAYERRIIHSFLQNVPEVTTESKGEGADRRVVIKYVI
jgi:hypothetical protein